MILPSSSRTYMQMYVPYSMWESRNKTLHAKLQFFHNLSLSWTLVKDPLPTKALICAQNDIAFTIVFALSSFVCKLARPAVLTGYKVANIYSHFEATKGQKLSPAPCTCAVHLLNLKTCTVHVTMSFVFVCVSYSLCERHWSTFDIWHL